MTKSEPRENDATRAKEFLERTRAIMTVLKDLDPTARRIFEFYVKFKRANDGCSPVFEEVVEACNLSSPSVVTWHLEKLEAVGLIKRLTHETSAGQVKTRGIMITGAGWKPSSELMEALVNSHDPLLVRERHRDGYE